MSENIEQFELLLQGPFVKELENCWTFDLDLCPEEWHSILLDQSDTNNNPRKSKLKLFEDSVELGPDHSPHSIIREVGGGAFSHWKGGLYFSSSDTSVRLNRIVFEQEPILARPGGRFYLVPI